MHELSIAYGIIELAERYAQNHNAKEIEEVELEIGSLAGIELQSLEFALESSVKGTMLDNAHFVRHIIKAEGKCGDCDAIFPLERLFSECPYCHSYCIKVIKGKELRIKSIVIK